jgi:hypothetical protein
MSLPIIWIDKIFYKLTVAYGRDFLGRWEGVPIDDIKADWAECLSWCKHRPDAIAYALDNLPDNKAPTAQDFRAITYLAPTPDVLRIPEPASSPAIMALAMASLAPMKASASQTGADSKGWAKRIVANHIAGLKINVGPLRMAREALGLSTSNA